MERIFGHALEDSHSKSGLVNSLSVCISILDPKRSAMASPLMHSFRSQHMYESPIPVNPETISAMLPKLGEWISMAVRTPPPQPKKGRNPGTIFLRLFWRGGCA